MKGKRIVGCLLLCLFNAGSSWAASEENPVAFLNLNWKIFTDKNGLPNNTVNVICAGPGQVYIGTNNGLAVLNKRDQTIKRFDDRGKIPNAHILALALDKEMLWIGTEQGLAVLETGSGKILGRNPVGGAIVSSLLIRNDDLFIVTNQGCYRYNLRSEALAAAKEIKGVGTTGLMSVEDGVLAITNGEIHLWNLETQSADKIEIPLNTMQSKISAMAGGGDYLWFATGGSGLIGYDLMKQEWLAFTKHTEVDAFLTSMAPDGKYLWIGTFSGLFRYSPTEKKWLFLQNNAFAENPVSALAVDGETLWVGTAGSGLACGDKKAPYISTQLHRRYFLNEKIKLVGQVQADGPFFARIKYRPEKSQSWQTQHTEIAWSGNEFKAQVDFRNLPDASYEFVISATDSQQAQNEDYFTLAKETKPLAIDFQTGGLHAGRVTLMGEYRPRSIEKITIFPGGVPAVLDRAKNSFTASLDLTQKDKQIQLRTVDQAGRTKQFTYAVQILSSPEVHIAAAQGSFSPGIDDVCFTLTTKHLNPVEFWELTIAAADGQIVFQNHDDHALPRTYTWEGKDAEGKLVAENQVLNYTLKVKEMNGLEISTPKQALRSTLSPNTAAKSTSTKISRDFLFNPGEVEIKPIYLSIFDEIVKVQKEHAGSIISVEGHADDRPIRGDDFPSNQELSEARAMKVLQYLTGHCGIDPQRVTVSTLGYGATRPLNGNKTWAERANNRRVEVYIINK